jgi:hypothetical protein
VLGKTAQDIKLVTQVCNGEAQRIVQFVERITAHIAQRHMFALVPHIFTWIKFWGVAWYPLHLQPRGRAAGQEGFDYAAPMDRRSIPHDQQLAPNMLHHVLEKAHHPLTAIRSSLHAH